MGYWEVFGKEIIDIIFYWKGWKMVYIYVMYIWKSYIECKNKILFGFYKV